jgi:glycerol-3-phosphate acyltransferase PlsY
MLLFGLALPFLFGSIPFGLLITQAAGLGDIRAIGSGNVGATNVLRTGKKWLALATLLADAGKGAVAVIIARLLSPDAQMLAMAAGVFAILGHMFSPWLQFKGGKGVATSAGVMLALSWPVGLAAIAVWLFMAWRFRYSSLAALSAAAAAPLLALLLADWQFAICYLIIAVLVIWRHEANIRRLLKGEESKISFGRG